MTDHDTVAGVLPAQLEGDIAGIEVVAGVELALNRIAAFCMCWVISSYRTIQGCWLVWNFLGKADFTAYPGLSPNWKTVTSISARKTSIRRPREGSPAGLTWLLSWSEKAW